MSIKLATLRHRVKMIQRKMMDNSVKIKDLNTENMELIKKFEKLSIEED